jgi:hypothetical protein
MNKIIKGTCLKDIGLCILNSEHNWEDIGYTVNCNYVVVFCRDEAFLSLMLPPKFLLKSDQRFFEL